MASSERRIIHFESLDDVLRDAAQLAAVRHRTTGNWTLGQICEHLALASDACFDGFGDIQVPWWARWFIAPFVKKKFLLIEMRAGIQLPKTATRLLPASEVSVNDGLAHLRRSFARFECEIPAAAHPFLGKLKGKHEYVLRQLRHGELHLSHVFPAA